MKRILLLTVLLMLTAPLYTGYAQNKRVRNITGRCEVTRDISLAQAEERALEDAKINAMRKAGVPERLWSVTGLINEDDGSEFSQVLSRMTTLEVNGLITVKEVDYSEEMIDGRRYAVATIDADVKIVDTEVDLTFQMEVDGLKNVYGNGEAMSFKLLRFASTDMTHISLFSGSMTTEARSYIQASSIQGCSSGKMRNTHSPLIRASSMSWRNWTNHIRWRPLISLPSQPNATSRFWRKTSPLILYSNGYTQSQRTRGQLAVKPS